MPGPSQPPPEGFARSGEDVVLPPPRDLPEDLGFDPAEFPPELLEARAAIEEVLSGQGDERSGIRSADDVTELTNIQGIGIGRATLSQLGPQADAVEPGQPTLTVYLAQPRSAEDVKAVLVDRMGVGAAASPRVVVVPVVTGPIEAQLFDFQQRPAPGGISVLSDPNALGFGTLGCLTTGRTPPRDQRTLILSCNHILANSNLGRLGDCVDQPATGDAGVCPDDLIAVLERFVPVTFGGPINSVDCATAWADAANVSPNVLARGPGGTFELAISSTTAAATVGAAVGKSGRTTEVTAGTVQEVGASHWVGYPGGNSAFFSGSIAITGSSSLGLPFTGPGDSGAIVWTDDENRNPIGLHFAGTNNLSRSFSNQIDTVTQALDVFITGTI
ncbi:hypothetical protein BX285_6762 [Streptomyces sp. 1114.5]|uniref:hypothetical protein n=1 Tax=unclassified Streptomyces TaxID=2593676 RepID=UPI000BD81854|nr:MULTISPECIES: hypothetical protein [unclassified Streptomyces]RKT09661.1 hypothetical protein BX285_6762 [Streptomyces sp. 1114.5]SOB89005.1 hypothetical protein SAMN06272789_7333 [Streptomyces sp. 1331.2]